MLDLLVRTWAEDLRKKRKKDFGLILDNNTNGLKTVLVVPFQMNVYHCKPSSNSLKQREKVFREGRRTMLVLQMSQLQMFNVVFFQFSVYYTLSWCNK